MKVGGYQWLYFYRSGSFSQFLTEIIRDLVKKLDVNDTYHALLLLQNNELSSNHFIDGIMDDAFVDYANLYEPQSYIKITNLCGLDIVSSSKLDPYNKSIDHNFAHSSVILCCKKTRHVNKIPKKNIDELSSQNSINQLDLNLYGEYDSPIRQTLQSFLKLKDKLIDQRNDLINFSLIYRLSMIKNKLN